jgi:dTDP-4-amino-4,6-dideoxygalactose transaminase
VNPIPLVDLKAQYASIKTEIQAALDRVLGHAGFILGPETTAFEGEFAHYTGAGECVGTASGTGALWLSLWALGIQPGDEVITAAHTFMATGEAISLTGARPVFVDIDPASFTLDPSLVEKAITSKTRAIVPVHLYGHPADMDALTPVAKRAGLIVVEDAAQAHGAALGGRRCGTLGDLACFSFFPGKNLGAYGDAGAVTGSPSAALARVRKLRDHGRTSKYEHDEIGAGERIDALQAAVLSVKLKHLEVWTEARRRIASRYCELLSGLPLSLPQEASGMRHVYHLFVVRTPRRDDLMNHLKLRGIASGVHYPVPLHRQPAYLRQGYGNVSLPETERAAAEVLSLPIYPEMSDEQVARVAGAVREYFR